MVVLVDEVQAKGQSRVVIAVHRIGMKKSRWLTDIVDSCFVFLSSRQKHSAIDSVRARSETHWNVYLSAGNLPPLSLLSSALVLVLASAGVLFR